MFLLDSNIVILHLRGRRETHALLQELLEEGPLCASSLTRFEVLQGARREEMTLTLLLLDSLETLDVDIEVADLAGSLSRRYRQLGRTLPAVDCLIAATALVHDLILVTHNFKDFPMPELRIHGRE